MFAAVRWFHLCPGTQEHKSYYYPDRKIAALFYTVPVVLLPYMLSPQSRESWLLAKGYYPLTHFFYCAVLLLNYFGNVRQWHRWHVPGIVSAGLVFVPVLALLVIALIPGLQMTAAQEQLLIVVICTVGLLMTVFCALAMWQVLKWSHEYSTDNFSNTDDFPLGYARGVMIIPLIHALLIWPVVITDSQAWLAAVQLLLSAFNVVFLISVLPSKRMGSPLKQMIEQNREDDAPHSEAATDGDALGAHDDAKAKDIPDSTRQKIVEGIEEALVRQQLYLNPSLSLKEVADVCGYNRAYVSRVLREQYGGFFDYVNMLRCRHVDDYLSQHPQITKEEAIIKSGFKDRQTYYRIKKHLSTP